MMWSWSVRTGTIRFCHGVLIIFQDVPDCCICDSIESDRLFTGFLKSAVTIGFGKSYDSHAGLIRLLLEISFFEKECYHPVCVRSDGTGPTTVVCAIFRAHFNDDPVVCRHMGRICYVALSAESPLVDGNPLAIIGVNLYPPCIDMYDRRLVIVLIGH